MLTRRLLKNYTKTIKTIRILLKKAGKNFGVCMNPEFMREGSSIYDYNNPPLTLIGELDKKSGDTLEKIYTDIDAPLYRSNIKRN